MRSIVSLAALSTEQTCPSTQRVSALAPSMAKSDDVQISSAEKTRKIQGIYDEARRRTRGHSWVQDLPRNVAHSDFVRAKKLDELTFNNFPYSTDRLQIRGVKYLGDRGFLTYDGSGQLYHLEFNPRMKRDDGGYYTCSIAAADLGTYKDQLIYHSTVDPNTESLYIVSRDDRDRVEPATVAQFDKAGKRLRVIDIHDERGEWASAIAVDPKRSELAVLTNRFELIILDLESGKEKQRIDTDISRDRVKIAFDGEDVILIDHRTSAQLHVNRINRTSGESNREVFRISSGIAYGSCYDQANARFFVAKQKEVEIYNKEGSFVTSFALPGMNAQIESIDFDHQGHLLVFGRGTPMLHRQEDYSQVAGKQELAMMRISPAALTELMELKYVEGLSATQTALPVYCDNDQARPAGELIRGTISEATYANIELGGRVNLGLSSSDFDEANLNAGFYAQGNEGTCSVNAFATALDRLGIDLPDELFLNIMGSTYAVNLSNGKEHGTWLGTIDMYAKRGDYELRTQLQNIDVEFSAAAIKGQADRLKSILDSGDKVIITLAHEIYSGRGTSHDFHTVLVDDYRINDDGSMDLLIVDSNTHKSFPVGLELIQKAIDKQILIVGKP